MNTDVAIVGGYGDVFADKKVEVISIKNDSILQIDKGIPSLPKDLVCIHGARLPNGNYIKLQSLHATVCMNGCTYSCGGWDSLGQRCALHEVMDRDGVVIEKKELPLILIDHTATKIDNNRFLVAGGWDQNVTKTFQINK